MTKQKFNWFKLACTVFPILIIVFGSINIFSKKTAVLLAQVDFDRLLHLHLLVFDSQICHSISSFHSNPSQNCWTVFDRHCQKITILSSQSENTGSAFFSSSALWNQLPVFAFFWFWYNLTRLECATDLHMIYLLPLKVILVFCNFINVPYRHNWSATYSSEMCLTVCKLLRPTLYLSAKHLAQTRCVCVFNKNQTQISLLLFKTAQWMSQLMVTADFFKKIFTKTIFYLCAYFVCAKMWRFNLLLQEINGSSFSFWQFD